METATYVRKEPSVPFILRVLWFFLIGWHVTLYWIVAAWAAGLGRNAVGSILLASACFTA